ncbi:site-specific DNA-methyltransferase [Bradyrhizobium sp. 139]|uniref:site-specific DNA-methyltransferase n=1 Tax=Bradyrhizobium sp. 139 TaxID=2782616 RepID=UPI001FF8F376|nr:site-specific DNA-methyltransferase [Bradyrhizobium sp. 139]MCK1740343.1 site-specific DNA-methyltransferase [Bradyrhizobium sp. 139]
MSKTDSDRLTVEHLSPQDLRPNVSNTKLHPKRQIEKIAKSIKRFGFANPVLISDDMEIIAGHGRVEAAKHLGLKLIPVVRLSGLTAVERLAYTLADNRLAEFGRYDRKQLAIQLEQLTHLAFDDVEVTGFSLGDIDIRLDRPVEQNGHPVGPDDALPAPERRIVSRRGDLWKLGGHYLLCGDPTSATDVRRLMGGQQAEVVFLDPRRNLGASARSEMEVTEVLSSSLRLAKGASKPGTIIFVFLSGLNYELFTAARAEQLPLETVVVWAKRGAGMGGLYRSQHELIAVLKNGDAADLSSSSLAQHGRHRSNLWKYAEGASLAGHDETLSMHLTCRPVALIADAIRDVSGQGAIVLDTFAGSGSTLIAAEKTGRRAYLLEVEPACCDVIIRRFHRYTGQAAQLGGEGLTFGDVEKNRLADRIRLEPLDQP